MSGHSTKYRVSHKRDVVLLTAAAVVVGVLVG